MSQETLSGFQLSPQQERLWRLLRSGHAAPYRAQARVRIEGRLDADILDSALRDVVRRHEILRTTFHLLPAKAIPVQVVQDDCVVSLKRFDFSDLPAREQEAKVNAVSCEMEKQSFEPGEAPLISVAVATLAREQHMLFLSASALCADSFTLQLLVREIADSYEASLRGEELPEPDIQYADVAGWQSELLEDKDAEIGRAYWRGQGACEFLNVNLPTSTGEEASQFSPKLFSVPVRGELEEKIDALGGRYEVSTSVLLLAAWQVLLWRLTNQTDFVIGASFDGRQDEELKSTPGPLARYLPLHCHSHEEAKFPQALESLARTVREAAKWQESFSWAHASGAGDADDARSLYAVCFDYDEQPAPYRSAQLSFAIERQQACLEPSKVKLRGVKRGDSLITEFHYNASQLAPDDVERMADCYHKLLESICASPEARLDDFDILPEQERERLLFELNRTEADYPASKTVQELFEERAAETPQAIAVACHDRHITYGELNRRANQVARFLRTLSVGAEQGVALCIERSPEMIVGITGILKAGAAYVPLDSSYPQERLDFILSDAGASVLLTQEHLAQRFASHALAVVCLDSEGQAISQQSTENTPPAGPDNLAYVIYTSGSTGRPKGVLVSQRNLMHSTSARFAYYVHPAESFLLLSSIAFDSSVAGIFWTLCQGGRLVVPPEDFQIDLTYLAELVERNEVTSLLGLPSLYALLLEQAEPRQLSSLRTVIVAGEACPLELPRRHHQLLPHASLFNEYGPTEATVWSSVYNCPAETARRQVPIGTPINNTQLYVLDAALRPVPVGSAGELFVGGEGITRGYLNHPDLTAEKFIPDPFSRKAGARLYRTGDLVRYLPDGNLEFLGRVDHQVKIRGYRIELGEIEETLKLHPAVRDCVVLAREDAPGDKRLVAYLVRRDGHSQTSAAELRAFVRERLTDYMTPAAFVVLDALPLTPNGKVDRKALPHPAELAAASEERFVPPRNALEEVLAGIWSELLYVARVGVHDNFFDIGGHSLLATQLVSRVRETLKVELPVRSLFERPTVAGLAEIVEQEMSAGESAASLAITLVPRTQPLPLSFAQQRLWFLNRMEPRSVTYNVPVAARLSGKLEVALMERALGEIVRRHETLRTTFATEQGQPVQVIAPPRPVSLPVVDLRHLAEPEREQEARRLSDEEARKPFDLAQGPVWRACLLRLAEDEHLLLVTMHHIVTDGWSMGILVRELSEAYRSLVNSERPQLPPLPIQYADFAHWQREWLQSGVLEAQLEYWRNQLRSPLATLELPTDKPRPPLQSYRGAQEPFLLSTDLLEGLRALSRQARVTLFMTLLAAFEILLARYTGQTDIVVGADVANRNRAEVEGLIGFFVNMMVLRGDLSGDPSFIELLSRVREVALSAYAHQDVPFQILVDELNVERDLSRTPLFQVVFVLQNAPIAEADLSGLRITPAEVETGATQFDLILSMSEEADGLAGLLTYNTDLFEAATIKRMIGHLQRVLEGVVADPHVRLSSLPLLGEPEREQLLRVWNRTAVAYPSESCIHRHFEAQVEQRPDAVALVYGDERLTYRELNSRANQLAHYLQTLGVGPDTPVALCVERSVEMITGLLGILKAGAAYLALDAEYPLERLTFVLDDAQAPVLLTQESMLDALPAHWGHVLCLDSEWGIIALESEENPSGATVPDNLAYVTYTSGSTGQPKGVEISHRSVLRLVYGGFAELNERQRIMQLAPLAFDASTFEVWGALLHGGQCVLYPERVPTAAKLGQAIERYGVTTMWLTASLYNTIVAEAPGALRKLRQLLIGGEALSVAHVRRGLELLPSTQLINGYGPTESTTFTCCHPVDRRSVERGTSIPLGRPIGNTQVYILDANMQPVPVGVAGELYIGGDGLARGYLHRPELTAERFIPNPYGEAAGGRLYRSGDLARYLQSGEVEYLGRVDEQVKLRGFRIELGEIEATLKRHSALREVTVMLREDAPGEKRLVAYLVCEDDERVPDNAELREFMKGHLPEYMIPSTFVVLDAMPLTPNGKIDRRALPAPEQQRREEAQAYAAPSTPAEEALAAVWADALKVERVGVNDNFFELGGDSIRVIQVIAAAQKHGLELSIQQVFQHPTIAELARHLETNRSAPAAVEAQPFSLLDEVDRQRLDASIEDAYPLTMLQAGMIFHSEYSPETAVYHDIFTYHLRAPFDPAALRAALDDLTVRHSILRTSFDFTAFSEPLQLVHRRASIPMRAEDLRGLSENEQEEFVARLLADEKAHPFDWHQPPPVRVLLHRRSEQTFQFTLSFHHALLDGWSVASMLTELFARYQSHIRGMAAETDPPLQSTFRDYVVKERQVLQAVDARRFWDEKLSDSVPSRLPRWPRAYRDAGARRIRSFAVALPPQLSDGLKQLADLAAVPLKSVLLAAHLRVIAMLGGHFDVMTGLVSHGRPEVADGERVLGLFLNTLPLRLRLNGGNWLQLVRETSGAERELLPYRHYPMAQVQRDRGGEPLFESIFNYTHFHVYQGLQERGDVEILAGDSVTYTNFTFQVDFFLDLNSTQVLLDIGYDSVELCQPQIETIGEYYRNTLALMAHDPYGRYDACALLPEAEWRQIVLEWNDTAAYFPRRMCLHELFEVRAERTPDAVALIHGETRLSYGELNRRANCLAHYLRGAGVVPETLVGICVERSVDMLVGMLGILKAGGAYVPLDPQYPQERLHFMLEDSQVPVLLTQQHLTGRLPQHRARVVCLDSDWPRIADESDQTPVKTASSANIAYVIYTSGSTGQPKGVCINHGSGVALAAWAASSFRHEHLAGVLASTSICFDLSIYEIFVTLGEGGAVILVENAMQLPTIAAKDEVTLINTVPSAMAELLRMKGVPSSVRTVNLAGEPLQNWLVQQVYAQTNASEVWNLYGPSEDTTYSTFALVKRGADEQPTIGRPIANTQVYLLDRNLQPAPIGAIGELFIGGEGLARGYLRRPALTAERFIPNPFSREPGARLYRTGDLARYRPDGQIEFLGRADNQVKLRGHRIELGEVESVLAEHAGVTQCAVMVRERVDGEPVLVAYVAGDEGREADEPELRRYARQRLPGFMVPALFVKLRQLPLTPNGKVDRKALPHPAELAAHTVKAYAAPRTPEEKILAGIWAELFKVERVSIDDNFFSLGGHSLLATRVVKQISETFKVELPLSILFEAPTLAALATAIVKKQLEQQGREKVEDMMAAIAHLSDEEVAALLAEDREGEEATGD